MILDSCDLLRDKGRIPGTTQPKEKDRRKMVASGKSTQRLWEGRVRRERSVKDEEEKKKTECK